MVGWCRCHFTCSYHLLISDLVRGQEKQQPSGVKFWASGIWRNLRKALPTFPSQFFNCSLLSFWSRFFPLSSPPQKSRLKSLSSEMYYQDLHLLYLSPSWGLFEIDNSFISPSFPNSVHHWNTVTQVILKSDCSFQYLGQCLQASAYITVISTRWA